MQNQHVHIPSSGNNIFISKRVDHMGVIQSHKNYDANTKIATEVLNLVDQIKA